MAKIRKFFQKWILNNIGFKILALIFAFVVWLVIMNTTDPVTTRTITGIPVEILNEDKVKDGEHVYTIVSGNTATIVVSGNRSIIGSLSASDFRATADFSELSLTNAVPIHIEMTGEYARYANAITITQKTNSMVIALEAMKEVSLDVEVQFNGKETKDMIIEDAVPTPAKVTLHAPESIAVNAEKAVAMINYSDVTGTMEAKTPLIIQDRNGNVIEQQTDVWLDQTEVTVAIQTSSVKTLPVRIEPVGTPAEGYVLDGVSYSKESFALRCTQGQLDDVTEILLPGDLLNIQGADKDVKVTIDLNNYLPYGVTIYGDTGTLTISATIKKQEATTEVTETTTN